MAVNLRGLHSEVRQAAEVALAWANYYGIPITITSTYRSWEEQAKLRDAYERCLSRGTFPTPGVCPYPANRPGDSAHNFGLAFDSWTPYRMEDWKTIRRWCGFHVPDNDPVHAEVPGWRQYVA